MKKLLLFIAAALSTNFVNAQPWMPVVNGPVKYQDALNSYKNSPYYIDDKDAAHESEGNEEKENKNHLFKKWDWYWSHHLDQNGYMVPPVKALAEWQNYIQVTGSNAAARITAIPSNWVFQGPDACDHGYSGMGRINVVAFDPVDSNIIYVGSAAGSTWKTTDGGLTWAPLYSNLPTLGVADIKVNPLNRNTIYVATGDGDAGDAYSSGVIVSHNGGTTWSTTGLNWLPTAYNTAHSLLINPLDTSSMILGSNVGIFKSYNSGVSWTNVFAGNFKQLLYNPSDTTIVYASMYTDTSAQVMKSTDGGTTWTAVTSFSAAQRINIAVCPAMPNLVMAVASANSSSLQGIYTSKDNGSTFNPTFLNNDSCTNNLLGYNLGLPTNTCDGQAWYDLCIAVNPADPSQVVVGGVNTYYSSDTGNSWTIANQWYGGLTGVETVHADKHCLAYNPISGGLYETCDGGIYKNYGPVTQPWTDLSDGIDITEFYRNAVDNQVTYCIGGAQDNGTKMIDIGVATDLTGGDGMQPLINYGDPADIWYCSFPSGGINMTRDGGATYNSITDTIHGSGAWVTPYVIHPSDTETLVIAYDQVYASHNNGLSWTPISPVFDSNADITTLAIAPSNPNYLYATYFDYNVWEPFIRYTPDFGVTWDTITPATSSYISDLVVDPKDEQRFWITISAYGSQKVMEYYMPTRTWTNMTGTLPDIPVQCMLIDTNFKTKYIGTDAAIYYRDTTMTEWALFNTNLPSVEVDDLHINYSTNEIWAATFGRGMWMSVKADKPPLVGVPALQQKIGNVSISPNPNQGIFTISATGTLLTQSMVDIRILSSDGKEVWQTSGVFDQSGRMAINTTGLAAGFYVCEVSCKGGVVRSKLVIY